jgi:hypothetical protein
VIPLFDRVFVIGMGEVGRRFAAALAGRSAELVPVTKETGWERAASSEPGVRLVCVREERLAEVIARLNRVDPASLVFVQNGWIGPLVAPLAPCTRGLIWFRSKGDLFEVLRPTVFSGPLAGPLATAFIDAGVAAEAVGDRTFRVLDAEKMGFNCVVGLPLAVHGVTLGEYIVVAGDEAAALFGESVSTCAAALGVATQPGWWDEFLRVSRPLAGVRASAAKGLEFRNGAVARLARDMGLAVPVTERLLATAGFAG